MGIFHTLKQVMTGEVVQTIETPANGGLTTMSLRLKRKSGEHYVVLAGISSGNYQYFSFERGEFDRFAQAVETIRSALPRAV